MRDSRAKYVPDSMKVVDSLLARLLGLAAGLRIPPPVMLLLGHVRAAALGRVLPTLRAEAAHLAPGLGRGDPEVEAAFFALAKRSISSLREETLRQIRLARGSRTIMETAFWLDQRFCACDRQELMDDPEIDPCVGQRLVARLDHLNRVLGSYGAFFRGLVPLVVAEVPGRPIRILELAAGAGGFSLWMAREAERRGLPLEIIATDLREDFLALGRERAAKEGLSLRFQTLDALSLDGYPEEVDLVVCVQAIHHFSPGALALLFHRAAQRARRAVVLIDGCRSALLGAAFLAVATLRFADPAYLHDAWISFRRFYLAEELALLCGLGPRGQGVTVSHIAPGHCLLVRPTPPL